MVQLESFKGSKDGLKSLEMAGRNEMTRNSRRMSEDQKMMQNDADSRAENEALIRRKQRAGSGDGFDSASTTASGDSRVRAS